MLTIATAIATLAARILGQAEMPPRDNMDTCVKHLHTFAQINGGKYADPVRRVSLQVIRDLANGNAEANIHTLTRLAILVEEIQLAPAAGEKAVSKSVVVQEAPGVEEIAPVPVEEIVWARGIAPVDDVIQVGTLRAPGNRVYLALVSVDEMALQCACQYLPEGTEVVETCGGFAIVLDMWVSAHVMYKACESLSAAVNGRELPDLVVFPKVVRAKLAAIVEQVSTQA